MRSIILVASMTIHKMMTLTKHLKNIQRHLNLHTLASCCHVERKKYSTQCFNKWIQNTYYSVR